MWLRKISSLGHFPYADEHVEGDIHHANSENNISRVENGDAISNTHSSPVVNQNKYATNHQPRVATPIAKPHKSRKISRGRFTIRRSRKLATTVAPPPEIVITPATPQAKDKNLDSVYGSDKNCDITQDVEDNDVEVNGISEESSESVSADKNNDDDNVTENEKTCKIIVTPCSSSNSEGGMLVLFMLFYVSVKIHNLTKLK